MRWLGAGLLFLVSTALICGALFFLWIVFVLFIAGTECDRGTCNAAGEFAYEYGRAVLVTLVALSVLAGVLLTGLFLRLSR